MAYLMTDYAAGAQAAMQAKYAPQMAEEEATQAHQTTEMNKLKIGAAQMEQQRQKQYLEYLQKQAAEEPKTEEEISNSSFPQQVQKLNQYVAQQEKRARDLDRMGFPKESEQAREESRKALEKLVTVQTAHGNKVKDQYEIAGRVAKGYLQNSKDPEAWNQAVDKLEESGYPNARALRLVTDPVKREEIAKKAITESTTVQQDVTNSLKEQSEIRRSEGQKARQEHNKFTETLAERRQNYLERKASTEEKKADAGLGQKYKDAALRATQAEATSLNNMIKDIDGEIKNMTSAFFTPPEGMDVSSEVKKLYSQKDELMEELKSTEKELKKLGGEARDKVGIKPTTKETKISLPKGVTATPAQEKLINNAIKAVESGSWSLSGAKEKLRALGVKVE